MKYTRSLFTYLAVFGVTLAGVLLLVHGNVSAETAKQALQGGVDAAGSSGTDINKIIATVINVMSLLVGIVSVIMIIFGGFKYVTSSGDSGKTSSARSTIIYAIVGLVVAALAQAIVQFVLTKV